MRWIAIAGLALLAAGPAPAVEETWLVLSPRSRVDMESLRKWPRPDRCVLAVEDFRAGRLPERFLATVRDLREWIGPGFEMPVADAGRLSTVRRLGVRRLPALIVFRRGVIHVVEGIPKSPAEVLQCRP